MSQILVTTRGAVAALTACSLSRLGYPKGCVRAIFRRAIGQSIRRLYVTFLTDFGDPGVLLPVAAAILGVLLLLGQHRAAALWTLTLGMSLGVVLVLKLTFAGCVSPSRLTEIHSPSGHTASATLVYGGLIALLDTRLVITLVASVGCATLIGTSRLLLHLHTAEEAALGGGIGVLGVALLAVSLPRNAMIGSRGELSLSLSIVVMSLALALHGIHWRVEPLIRNVSHHYWPFRACGS